MTDLYTQDLTLPLAAFNMKPEDIAAVFKGRAAEVNAFAKEIDEGQLPAFGLAMHDKEITALENLVSNWRQRYTHMVFVGVGGSALGGKMLVEFMGQMGRSGPQVIFLDNVDPVQIDTLLNELPLETTGLLAVSKSGSTIETLMITSLFMHAFLDAQLDIRHHIFGLTEKAANPLRQLLTPHEVPILDHAPNIGGRFSVLSLVGLLPALTCGMDVRALRSGAAEVLQEFLKKPTSSAPAQGAGLMLLAEKEGYSTSVMMPYGQRLALLSHWYVQLWAESLGKGGRGMMPFPAVGSTDQHSSLQMMLAGPNDKVVTIILPDTMGAGRKVPDSLAVQAGVDELAGLCAGTLLYTQAHGTSDSLMAHGRPVRVLHTKALKESTLGALIMHLMLETAVTGILMDVNPWDQPAVEDGKARTREYLKRH